MSETPPAVGTYAEFWPSYLREHAHGLTRAIHIAGTLAALGCVVAAIVFGNAWIAPGALLAGYGPAWLAHFLVEKNRPATFRYPLWSLISDVRMTGTWLVGGLARELTAAGIASRK